MRPRATSTRFRGKRPARIDKAPQEPYMMKKLARRSHDRAQTANERNVC